MTERTYPLNAIKRAYLGIQENPPAGPWQMKLEEDDKVIRDTCDHDHRAGAREELERRFDAMMAMESD